MQDPKLNNHSPLTCGLGNRPKIAQALIERHLQDHGGEAFANRLGQLEAVVQNQDNREHDLLNSDNYYQFQCAN